MSTNEDALRVAVLENCKPLSGIWRIWRRNNDVYVAPRSVAGSFKVSLHESGKFRFRFTSDEKASKFLKEGQDRAVFKWPRPTHDAPIVILLQILFPEI